MLLTPSPKSSGVLTAPAVDPQTYLEHAGEELARLESEYAEAVTGLSGNNQPCFTIGCLRNRIVDYYNERLLPFRHRGEALEAESRLLFDRLVRRCDCLFRDAESLFKEIDQIVSVLGGDCNLFTIDFDGEVYRQKMGDGAIEMHSRILATPENPDGFIALMQPLGFDDDLPFYALTNQITGNRKVKLQSVTRDGIFYCNACEPAKGEVTYYAKNLKLRAERAREFREIEDVMCECRGLMEYLEETKSSPKLVKDAIDLQQYITCKGLRIFAEKEGRIQSLTGGGLSDEVLAITDKETRRSVRADPSPKIMLTSVDGCAWILFSACTIAVGKKQGFVLKPQIEPFHYKKAAYELFLKKLFESLESIAVLRKVIADPAFDISKHLYILSPVNLVSAEAKVVFAGRHRGCGIYHISPRNAAPRLNPAKPRGMREICLP